MIMICNGYLDYLCKTLFIELFPVHLPAPHPCTEGTVEGRCTGNNSIIQYQKSQVLNKFRRGWSREKKGGVLDQL